MEIVDRYLKETVMKFRMWITDPDGEVQQVRCEFDSIRPHTIYLGKYELKAKIEDWVLEGINRDAVGWPKRIIVFILDDGYQEEHPYRMLSCKYEPHESNEYGVSVWHMIAVVEEFTE